MIVVDRFRPVIGAAEMVGLLESSGEFLKIKLSISIRVQSLDYPRNYALRNPKI